MAEKAPKPIHSLILDAGPIIKNDPAVSTLVGQAEQLYTIPAVVEEIRDPVTRSRIETTLLPFIELRSPNPASIKIITDFARRTGDLEVLSRPDIHLMALAYELECEKNHGDWRLRSMPGQKRLNGAPPTADEKVTSSQAEFVPKVGNSSTPPAIPETRGAWGTTIPTPEPIAEPAVESVEQSLKATNLSEGEVSEELSPAENPKSDPENTKLPNETISTTEEIEETVEDSDEDGWITPANLKEHQAKDAEGSIEPLSEQKVMQVALITSDFAMQNVLLRMNLNLLSPSLQRIRQLKTWILRCHSCFDTTKDMSRQFCARCGRDTLLRTACSTDKDGNFKIHLKKNMQWSNRGNVYSIPKPVAGSSNGKLVSGGGKGGWGQSLILAEDQKEYVSAMAISRRKKEKDLMDENYLPGILSGDRGRAGGRTKVGAGKNVNSKKRR
ncbi:Nin one binding Zn-ribbon like-domain-containing protein [Bisporella sp. PMI_857]|nr:Nin one binding Zn-ribbon like-domain-containing protein [Bisporella sp. PMI_857]